MIDSPIMFAAGTSIYATVVDVNSDDYTRFQHFQKERFARLQSTRPDDSAAISPTYDEATETSPSHIIPVIVWRRAYPNAPVNSATDTMVAIARLELPGATLIESMIELREGSVAAEALADGRAAEIGGFAALEGISRTELIDAVDALVGALTELARRREIAWLWIFPRAAFMSLLRAEIAPVLPPYHFTLSPDIVGWLPGSAQLEAFRAMRLRGFLDIPLMYQITTDEFTDDLNGRIAQNDQRAQVLREGNGSRLTRAMISAERTLREEITLIYPQTRHTPLGAVPARISSPLANTSRVRMAASTS